MFESFKISPNSAEMQDFKITKAFAETYSKPLNEISRASALQTTLKEPGRLQTGQTAMQVKVRGKKHYNDDYELNKMLALPGTLHGRFASNPLASLVPPFIAYTLRIFFKQVLCNLQQPFGIAD